MFPRSQHTIQKVLTLALTLVAVGSAGCGQAQLNPGLGNAAKHGTLAAHNTNGYDDPITLEDFDGSRNGYNVFAPVNHPFFYATIFTPVKAKEAGSTVIELLAPARSKPSRGVAVTDDVEEDGSFTRKEGDKEIMATGIRAQFKWGLNGPGTKDPCVFARVIFLVDSKDENAPTRALAYAWSNKYCVGTLQRGELRLGDDPIELATIYLRRGLGPISQECSAQALQKIPLETVTRDFDADMRWAFDKATPALDATSLETAADCPEKPPVFPPSSFVTEPGTDTEIPNKDLVGIVSLGYGADIAKGVCSHAIVDDVKIELKWPK